jgi:hypothetical protein
VCWDAGPAAGPRPPVPRWSSGRLQHPQPCDLRLQRQRADLVQEDRPPVRQFEAPDCLRRGPRERAALMAEQLALKQGGGQGGAGDCAQRPLPARAEVMDRPGHKRLAGPGLAQHEHGGIGGGHLLDQAQDLLEGSTAPDDVLEVVFELDLLLEIPVLRLQAGLQGLDFREQLGSVLILRC